VIPGPEPVQLGLRTVSGAARGSSMSGSVPPRERLQRQATPPPPPAPGPWLAISSRSTSTSTFARLVNRTQDFPIDAFGSRSRYVSAR
jgi:hypothetical protein